MVGRCSDRATWGDMAGLEVLGWGDVAGLGMIMIADDKAVVLPYKG